MTEGHYLLIGNGRIAKHMRHYFSALGLRFSTWDRLEPYESLEEKSSTVTHILLLISDHAIESFVNRYLHAFAGYLIHVSGSLVSNYIYGAHWLSTFNHSLYHISNYTQVPFIVDHDAPPFQHLLPGLPNPHVRLHKSLKPKYHALCVMSGNFSCLLWQKLFQTFNEEFKLPQELAYPFLQQQMQNLIEQPTEALTGPLVRHDTLTLKNNLEALEGDAFQMIYKTFVECYRKMNEEIA